jgi:hypothetical protein
MSLPAIEGHRFIRKTQLAPNEYRKNFRQIDQEIITAVTSAEADRVTPLMSKIYLRLVAAPTEFWEREGVLYFAPRDTDGHPVKASKVLYEVLGVASATAHKALQWLHEQGIIGYFAGKNGAGIRIFLNRAASSIGVREGTASKKILPFARGSNDATHGSTAEPAFKDSFADLETLDSDLDPRAPENGAAEIRTVVDRETADPATDAPSLSTADVQTDRHGRTDRSAARRISADELAGRLASEIVPHVKAAAAHEHERTREWFIAHALPKAIRISQRSAYDVLRAHGLVTEPGVQRRSRAKVNGQEVDNSVPTKAAPRPLSDDDITELSSGCVALLEVQGRSIEHTLAELSVTAGGFLLPEDAPKVRAMAESLLRSRGANC